jgi:hypothetical protein
MTGKCNCPSCIKCKSTRKPFTPNTTSHATDPLELVHLNIYGPPETAIGVGQTKPLFIDDAARYPGENIFRYKSEALDISKE